MERLSNRSVVQWNSSQWSAKTSWHKQAVQRQLGWTKLNSTKLCRKHLIVTWKKMIFIACSLNQRLKTSDMSLIKLQWQKISPVRDWQSTLHNWRFCQVQSHMTQKLGQISKFRPNQIQILCRSLRNSGQLTAPIVNCWGNTFENQRISNFQELMTLNLTLDRVILHTIVHHSSTSTYVPISLKSTKLFADRRTNICTDERTDIWDPLIRSSWKGRPKNYNYFAPGICAKHCNQRVCMSVCLYVCWSHLSKTTCPNFAKFSVHYLWPWLSSPLMAMHTLCISSFVDDVMFSHNEANGPESKMTRTFRPVWQMAAPGAKSAVSDCILFNKEFQQSVWMLFCVQIVQVEKMAHHWHREIT